MEKISFEKENKTANAVAVVREYEQIPNLTDEEIEYVPWTWRIAKLWSRHRQRWYYCLEHKTEVKQGWFKKAMSCWSRLCKSDCDGLRYKDNDEKDRFGADLGIMAQCVEHDPDFQFTSGMFFSNESSANDFVKVYERFRRQKAVDKYLRRHPQYIDVKL